MEARSLIPNQPAPRFPLLPAEFRRTLPIGYDLETEFAMRPLAPGFLHPKEQRLDHTVSGVGGI